MLACYITQSARGSPERDEIDEIYSNSCECCNILAQCSEMLFLLSRMTRWLGDAERSVQRLSSIREFLSMVSTLHSQIMVLRYRRRIHEIQKMSLIVSLSSIQIHPKWQHCSGRMRTHSSASENVTSKDRGNIHGHSRKQNSAITPPTSFEFRFSIGDGRMKYSRVLFPR